ncbi:hypothetical protein Verru16b_00758 [Lacunisphaera limnophila]|uniref:PilZ domain-containing protein n=1 Tax=Lacunisphaera limnophila TaxID=1838286 RepID=A0A1D8AS30_9BACT|nr:PilZ domain-containing protein [Lacunisphaera limnophila]AOS43705.1 hypothetical protein Verru16b_00758 [Lacunisphaera limnophila]
MLLFSRILDFSRSAFSGKHEQRRSARYPVAPGFPLKATVNLLGTAQAAISKEAPGAGMSWGGAVADLSANGVSLRLPSASVTTRGERTLLVLALDDFALRIPCTVAHFRTLTAGTWCGLSLQFENDTQRQGYFQLLEAVVIGAGFAPASAPRARAGLQGERYRSESKAILTVWRDQAESRLHSLELTLGELTVRSESGPPKLTVHATGQVDAPPVTGPRHEEMIRFFRIVATNLSKKLPADLRARMQALANPPVIRPAR